MKNNRNNTSRSASAFSAEESSSRSALKFSFKGNHRSASKFSFDVSTLTNSLYTKITITILVVVSFLLLPKVGFLPLGAEGFNPIRNVLFTFSHANIFHLLCNILCLWQMRNINRFIIPAFVIQMACSLLPECTHNIMGMSGFLFAIIGLKCGLTRIGKRMVRVLAPFFIVTAFIPNVAVIFHLYCLIIAYFIGITYQDIILWKNMRQ